MGMNAHDAEDLVQGFIADRILENYLLARADDRQGRFRSLLIRSLENYVLDHFRRKRIDRTLKRTAAGQDETSNPDWRIACGQPCVDPFDVAWARQVLAKSISNMRDQCRLEGHSDRWKVFELRVIDPLWRGRPEPSCEELVQRVGLDSPRQAANVLVTAKRHFRRVLEETVAEYVCEGEAVTDELQQLASIVSRAGSLELELSEVECSSSVTSAGDWAVLRSESIGDPVSWGRLLDVDGIPAAPWSNGELAAIWREQLDRPVACQAPSQAHAAGVSGVATIGGLLREDAPSVEQLRHLRKAARDRMHKALDNGPAEVAWALYFAAIAAAYARHGARISRLDRRMLQKGFQTLRKFTWLDASTVELADIALLRLDRSALAESPAAGGDVAGRERKLAMLKDDQMRSIAELKLQGHTHREIAHKLGCSLRSVERKWSLIQNIWRTNP
jgi:DNA-directed RNA polymerase specialized sigma24 family protein